MLTKSLVVALNASSVIQSLPKSTGSQTQFFDDGGYGLIEWKQQNYFGSSAYVHFTNPDFVKFAESMGLKGYRITSAADVIPTLKTALAQDFPTVIDCPIDYAENLKLSQKSGDLSCKI